MKEIVSDSMAGFGKNDKKIIIGASIGNCVHVAGVYHFLQIARNEGYEAIFLGPAVSLDRIFDEIDQRRPDVVALGYRLTPDNVTVLLERIKKKYLSLQYRPQMVFGGTAPVSAVAMQYDIFSFISDGFDDERDAVRFFRGEIFSDKGYETQKSLTDRVSNVYPVPILRHHFGLPSLEDTIKGVKEISEAKVLDVISLGPDQNAQQYFFNQKKMQHDFDGAGGVPIRTEEDLCRLKEASYCGNYPLMRCYSGTSDVFRYADMLLKTIDNAWAAIPIFWYNELDGRGNRPIETSINESLNLIKWHAEKGVPIECNDPHHWVLRDAHDVISVVTAYIAAYIAKKLGVNEYISQYMFNVPAGISFSMDLARVLAMDEMVTSLIDEKFVVYKQTRAGLPLFHPNSNIAKGQLAASTFMQMSVRPHIIHVVGFCEADHAASAKEVIESCNIVKGVIKHTLGENFAIESAPEIVNRKNHLINEAKYILTYIYDKYEYRTEPLLDANILADIVKLGILDAVHIVRGKKFNGNLHTAFHNGACDAIDSITHEVLSEQKRLAGLEC